LLGEDIGTYGGAFQVTATLASKFPQQVIETPISEGAVVGMGVGMAMAGLRPVVEIMFMDFAAQVVDQVLNQAVKLGSMYAGQVSVPLLIRTPAGGYRSYGPTHSQSLENLFASIPGLRIVYPYSCQDYYTLFLHTMRTISEPTLFIENKSLYLKRGSYDTEVFYEPKPRVVQQGSGSLVLTYGMTVDMAVAAGESVGRVPTVVSISSLKPLLGMETIFQLVRQHDRVVVASESPRYASVAEHVAAVVYEQCFRDLKEPVRIVSSADTIIPFSPDCEKRCLISSDDIAKELL
jgi:pyruvate/2-oxoglutarate/acetoin dehydrogenase E1 component